jgi:hypothetical protein
MSWLSAVSRFYVISQPEKSLSNCLRVSSVAGQAHVLRLDSPRPRMLHDGVPGFMPYEHHVDLANVAVITIRSCAVGT